MAAPVLAATEPRRAGRRRLRELLRVWLAVYGAMLLATLIPAALLAIAAPALEALSAMFSTRA